jgi:uncharacterized protein YjbJ (UPF0337 family)
MNTTNKLNNKAQYWGGKAKETVGRVSRNRRTQYEGKLDQVKAKIKNKIEDLGGKAKEAVGKVTGDNDTRNEGRADQAKSNLKDAGEKVKDAFKK